MYSFEGANTLCAVYIYMYIHIYIHTYVHTYIHTCASTQRYFLLYVYVYVHVYVDVAVDVAAVHVDDIWYMVYGICKCICICICTYTTVSFYHRATGVMLVVAMLAKMTTLADDDTHDDCGGNAGESDNTYDDHCS